MEEHNDYEIASDESFVDAIATEIGDNIDKNKHLSFQEVAAETRKQAKKIAERKALSDAEKLKLGYRWISLDPFGKTRVLRAPKNLKKKK